MTDYTVSNRIEALGRLLEERVPPLRDQFAIAFAASVYADCVGQCENIGSFPEKWRDGIAEDVYLMADAMMKTRERE